MTKAEVDVARRLGPGEFAKYHALGNDYLVLDGAVSPRPTPQAVRAWCDRHTGFGSDGLLLWLPPQAGGDALLRIFNPDGSEAEKSGNGLRIFARFLYDAGYTDKTHLRIEVGGGTVAAELLVRKPRAADDLGPAQIDEICVYMGVPQLNYAAVQAPGGASSSVRASLQILGRAYSVALVSMGNPHCVVFDAPHTREALLELGPAIEHNDLFAQRTNVQLLHVVDRGNIDLLIWERGAGETMASGSSSCAAFAAAHARGLVDDHVQVHMPGGIAYVQMCSDGQVRLSGAATPVMRLRPWFSATPVSA